jgi:outer membrane protein insertion porin family
MRNSVNDLQQYPSWGSLFSVNVAATPPWSSFDGKDYTQPMSNADRYKWVEYHKWNFNAQWFMPLDTHQKLVLMARAQMGYLGYYDKNKLSPFEGFQMGGDGLSGYSLYGVETIGMRGYETNALTPMADYGVYASIYSKYILEMRYPIVRNASTLVYGLLFAEAGNAFNRLPDFKPFNLKRSAGFGVRIFLPYLGMLGIDWGYGFDKTTGSEGKPSGGRISFSMGMQM